jgi:dTDP-4-amino-4,6-dideoxygalactose transaminase
MPIPALAAPALRSAAVPARIPVARPLLPPTASLTPYLRRIDDGRWYSNFGPLLVELEARLAARFRAPTQVATVANGTVAITLALRALDCEPGDLCIIPAWTFVATAHAVRQAGLEPWLLDVDPDTWMLDPVAVEAALADAPAPVAAIVPVAAFGRLPDLDAWASLSRRTGLPVVVDAAAAFDALDHAPVPVTVSLHATKSVSTGEGGYVASQDAALIARVRALSVFGFQGDRVSSMTGGNFKLSEYAAAVGLASLDGWRHTRTRLSFLAQQVRSALALTPDVVFQPGWGANWLSSVCMVSTPEGRASEIAATLGAAGVDTRAWWGEGLHRQPVFENALRAPLPVTDHLAGSTLGLPFYVDMPDAEVWRLVDALMLALPGQPDPA